MRLCSAYLRKGTGVGVAKSFSLHLRPGKFSCGSQRFCLKPWKSETEGCGNLEDSCFKALEVHADRRLFVEVGTNLTKEDDDEKVKALQAALPHETGPAQGRAPVRIGSDYEERTWLRHGDEASLPKLAPRSDDVDFQIIAPPCHGKVYCTGPAAPAREHESFIPPCMRLNHLTSHEESG
eukprot:s29_g4.t1